MVRLAAKSPLFLALLGAITLSIESYLTLHKKSLCQTEACQAVGKYLTISEPLVVAGGAFLFWILALLLFFVERYPKKANNLLLVVLAVTLAMDSSLIGFQFFTIQQKCALCIAVAALLAIIAFLHCLLRKSFVILAILFGIWLGGFGVQAIMIMPGPQGMYEKMAFYSFDNLPKETVQGQRLTLIFSMHCPHCLDVIDFISKNNHIDKTIQLAIIDTDEESLTKIGIFLQQVPTASNPFTLLKEIKESDITNSAPFDKKLKVKAQNSLNFLSTVGVYSVPVLVAEQSIYEKTIIVGSTQIIDNIQQSVNNHHSGLKGKERQ